MQPSKMFRHARLLHKRDPQISNLSDLPSSIGNPTATLPQSIGASGVTADPSATPQIVTAEAPSGFTTVTETESLVESITSLDTLSTVVTTRTRIITNQSEYASLTSAAALSASTSTHSTTTSKTSAAATSSVASEKSSSTNTSTLIPAIVVPVIVVLLASLGVFWFLMRRRHKRELDSQPEFVMAGKGEKLSSRSNSGRSTSSLAETEKKSTAIQTTEISAHKSPPSTTSEWPSSQIGLARPLTPQGTMPAVASSPMTQWRPGAAAAERQYRNFSGPAPRPTTSGRTGPPNPAREPPQQQQQQRNRGYSNPAQRGPPPPSSRSGPSPTPRTVRTPDLARGGPSPVSQRPSPTMSSSQGFRSESKANAGPAPPPSAFRLRDPSPTMNHNARAQAPPRLAAPPPGAYNGASSISRYSPIVKEMPGSGPVSKASSVSGKREPPPPLQTSNIAGRRQGQGTKSPHSHSASPSPGLTEENMRIARLANSSRLGYSTTPAEPSPSPKLPPPATRSQLIPRESPKGKPENYFGGSTTSETEPQSPELPIVSMSMTSRSHRAASDRASIVSDPDEYEDIDAKSDISSLNEFERFDFGPAATARGGSSRGGSAAGQSLNYFASHNSPAGGRGSPFGNDATTYERW